MPLSTKARQQLKAKAHSLKPVIMVGNNGLSAAVIKEMDRALLDHELIKVKVQCADRVERQQLMDEIAVKCEAEVIQRIGSIAVVYRKRPE